MSSWACAVPTASATILVLMRERIINWVIGFFQGNHILSVRRKKRKMKKTLQHNLVAKGSEQEPLGDDA